ncbi:hypothetical protein [Herbidospora galbida]|uniref:hypothetical protein n=1 Tax=Herbidospora galbida TaxID=2575442 RepID=UPI0014857BFF|nr:hypothetical protein [Herbidospora galbida]
MTPFCGSRSEPWDIEPIDPDTFLLHEPECAPAALLNVLKEQAGATGRPPHPAMTLEDVLSSLEKCGVPGFVAEVRSHLHRG